MTTATTPVATPTAPPATADHTWESVQENRKRCVDCGLVAVRHLVGSGPRWWVEWIRRGQTWNQLNGDQAPACTTTAPAPTAPPPAAEQQTGNPDRTAGPRPIVTPGHCSTGNPRCGKKARLFPCGWRCYEHRPGEAWGTDLP